MSDTTLVRTVNGLAEAEQIKAFLEAHDIPCDLRGEPVGHVYGLTVDGLGAVRIHVPTEKADEARELLARADDGELTLGGDSDSAGR